MDFDVGPVHGPKGNGSVHHEFHIPRPGCFLAGCRNLFADVGGREEELSQGYVVIFQEQDLQLLADRPVAIDHAGDDVNQANRFLGFAVTGCGLAAEEIGPRSNGQGRIVL